MIRFALLLVFAAAPTAAVFSVMATTEPVVVSAPPHGEVNEEGIP